MQRSSESIGAIAAALAKAQTELINPEKSLVGIIGALSPREPGRSFRHLLRAVRQRLRHRSLGGAVPVPRRRARWPAAPQLGQLPVERHQLEDYEPYIYRTRDGGKTWQLITTGIADDAFVRAVREDPATKGLLLVIL